MQWFYVRDGRILGPVDDAEFREMARTRRIVPTDLVWNRSLGAGWVEASSVVGLFAPPETQTSEALPPPAPPLPPASPATPEPPSPPEEATAASIRPESISVVSPMDSAWGWMKAILFSPFNLGKWFALGFGAWLASLTEGGWSFPDLTAGKQWKNAFRGDPAGEQILYYLRHHRSEVFFVCALIAALFLIVGAVLLWVNCRGKFIFLDNVVNRRERIVEPWREYRREGNSLFVWRLVYLLVCLFVFGLMAAVMVWTVVMPCLRLNAFDVVLLPTLAAELAAILPLAILTFLIGRYLEDFVVPLMYRHRLTATEAWGVFLRLARHNAWRFIGYAFFRALLWIVAYVLVLAFGVATCCIGCCVMLIPYVGTVVLLPVEVFFRSYSIEYLAQYSGPYRQVPRP